MEQVCFVLFPQSWNKRAHVYSANDPAPTPQPSPTHGSYHWAFERYYDVFRCGQPSNKFDRLIAAALIPLTVAPFAAGTLNPAMDAIFCATIIIHSHIGFQYVMIFVGSREGTLIGLQIRHHRLLAQEEGPEVKSHRLVGSERRDYSCGGGLLLI